MLQLQELKCNYEVEPKGIAGSPVFNWKYISDRNRTLQEAYQLRIFCGGEKVYDSGRINSSQSVCVEARAFGVEPLKEYCWQVQIWDNHGQEATAESTFEGALNHWYAQWIEPANGGIGYEKPLSLVTASLLGLKPKGTPEQRMMPVTRLRREFSVKPGLIKARAYATAHGVYQLYFNGALADERKLAPEYSSYQKCLYYQIYDITSLLQPGDNACGALLADGWWGGRCGMGGECRQYGDKRAFLMQLELEYEDGSTDRIVTDSRFLWSDHGPIRYSDLFIGEMQDARLAEPIHFSCADYQVDESWTSVVAADYGYRELKPQLGGPVLPYRELTAKLIPNPKGEFVLDFGQVIAGYVRCRIHAPAGTEVTLEHSEVLDEKGNYYNNILGINKDQKDVFITSGNDDIFEPQFTFHGFRYVRITGLDKVDPADYTAVLLTTQMENLAEFSCSNEKLNRLYQNSRWSQWSNMISIPTDCPQREKAGWTGDIQIFAPTAAYHQDVDAFLRRWMDSVEAEQWDNGLVPPIIPYALSYQNIMKNVFHEERACGWSDACIIVPYQMYRMYQDKAILERFYPVMVKWISYVRNEAQTQLYKKYNPKKMTARQLENQKYLWNTGFHFGDWLVPSLKGKDFMLVQKKERIFSAIYYSYTTKLMAKIASLLEKPAEAEEYLALHNRIREAFMETYITDNGHLTYDSQGAYVLALHFDLIPQAKIPLAASRLKELILANGGRLDTGFLATPVLLETLWKHFGKQEAYRMLYQEECPGWMYEINLGATSIWEEWNGIKPDGKVGNMSYNHYAFGCVSEFMHQRIVGIQKLSPGYQEILICPEPDDTLTEAAGSYNCVYGKIVCVWKKENGKFLLNATIPCGTRATIRLPDGSEHRVGSGSYAYQAAL